MTILRRWDWVSRAALGAMVAGSVLFVAALLEIVGSSAVVVRLEDTPASEASDIMVLQAVQAELINSVTTVVSVAVAGDPFRADRRRSPRRYRFPSDRRTRRSTSAAIRRPRPSLPRVSLVGTVGGDNGIGIAAFRMPDRTSKVIRVGQSINGFELVRVDRGSATLVSPDTTLVLRLSGRKPNARTP